MKKSPGGSIFPYSYKGGELLGLHFGSFHADEEGLLPMTIRFFDDPEDAKTWLVSEN